MQHYCRIAGPRPEIWPPCTLGNSSRTARKALDAGLPASARIRDPGGEGPLPETPSHLRVDETALHQPDPRAVRRRTRFNGLVISTGLGAEGYVDRLDVWPAEQPAAQEWWRRVQAPPSFASAIPQKLGSADVTAMPTFSGRIRQRVAERRDKYRRLPKAMAA
jgi:hypothetical protein